MDDNELKIFKVIANFVKELEPLFGSKQKTVALYDHLIQRTALVHKKSILKHVTGFRNFCSENQEAILAKDASKITVDKIVYSTKVYLDMSEIFRLSPDNQTRNTIWEYLLTLSALLDPTSKAKQVLQSSRGKKGGREAEFLGDIISKVEASVDPDVDNPMAAIGGILSSGVFTELIGGMSQGLQDGSLDLGSLIGTVQNLVIGMNNEAGAEGDSTMNQINSMMGALNTVAPKVEEIKEEAELEKDEQ